jgi:hypothetical protein
MGTTKTRYADTNNQFAYKTDRAAFLARIRSKAEDLWTDGYRAACDPDNEPHTFLVWIENSGLAAGHKVNVADGTCTCRFMLDQETHPLDPADPALRIKCKHLKGIKELVAEEVTYFKGLEGQARLHPYNPGSCERAAHYAEQSQQLQSCWNSGVAAYTLRHAA